MMVTALGPGLSKDLCSDQFWSGSESVWSSLGAKLRIPLGSIAWIPIRQQGIPLSITVVLSACNE